MEMEMLQRSVETTSTNFAQEQHHAATEKACRCRGRLEMEGAAGARLSDGPCAGRMTTSKHCENGSSALHLASSPHTYEWF